MRLPAKVSHIVFTHLLKPTRIPLMVSGGVIPKHRTTLVQWMFFASMQMAILNFDR
jgi:hypothetical protein